MTKRVTIIQRFVPHYRLEFFNELKENLALHDISLNLIYGNPGKDASKKDSIDVVWGIKIKNKYYNFNTKQLLWQPCLKYISNEDLVIVEQANKNLLNYILIFRKFFYKRKFAFWGHGFNHQSKSESLGNKVKTYFLKSPNWWFAYTKNVKEYLLLNEFPGEKITTVYNAINTNHLRLQYQKLFESDVEDIRNRYDLKVGKTAIYCGGLYREKRIDFLIEAASQIRAVDHEFKLLVIGSGPDTQLLQNLIKDLNYIYYLGPLFGNEKIRYFKVSDIMMMPGLVGLAVLDSFALETPIVTTDYPFHSPEIEYIDNNKNGVITENNKDEYVNKIIDLLKSPTDLTRLIEGCISSSNIYTLDRMVRNFSQGIIHALIKSPYN